MWPAEKFDNVVARREPRYSHACVYGFMAHHRKRLDVVTLKFCHFVLWIALHRVLVGIKLIEKHVASMFFSSSNSNSNRTPR